MMSERPTFTKAQIPMHEFLSEEIVRNEFHFPWFNVSVRSGSGKNATVEVLMIPTLQQLKKVFAQENELFRIESLEYATPGQMNGSEQWRMERVLEISELFNAGGWSIPRCKVEGGRTYRGLSLEPSDEWGDEKVLFQSELGTVKSL